MFVFNCMNFVMFNDIIMYKEKYLIINYYSKMFTGCLFHLPRYSCEKCGNSYKYKANLRRHEIYECGIEKMFICTICERRFHQKSNLNRHYSLLHN